MARGALKTLRGSTKLRVAKHALADESTGQKVLSAVGTVLASWLIVAIVLPFWFMQFFLWVLGMGGLALESVPLVGWVVPGQSLFYATSFFGAMLGLLFMMIAVVVYLFRGVDCMGGGKGLIFAVLLACSMFSFTYFIPWVFVYCFFVTILQTGERQPA